MAPSLFGIDIAGIVNDSIQGAGGLRPAVLTKATYGARTAGSLSGGKAKTTKDYAASGLIEDYRDDQIDGEVIVRGDRKVMLLGASIEGGVIPAVGDEVTIEGASYRVEHVTRDPAAATYSLQARG